MFRRLTRCGLGAMWIVVTAMLPAACDHSSTKIITGPVPVELPAQITECETNTQKVCGIWTLIPGTRTYSATWPQGSKATITVVQFDSDGVVFTRRDSAGPTSDMNASYVGFIRGTGESNGVVQWTTGGQTFTGTWTASWSSTNVTVEVPLPTQISECETNTQRVCGTWTLTPGTRTYAAVWSQGSKATISAVQFDSVIVFTRVDNAGPTPEMHAQYLGIPAGARVNTGVVQWTEKGLTISGKWDASW